MNRFHTQSDPEALLTEVAAADFLQMSIRTLQGWRSRGVGPAFVRAGRAVRYRRQDLITWIEANRVSLSPGVCGAPALEGRP